MIQDDTGFTEGQSITVRIDNIRWPARVVKLNVNGSLRVHYGKWTTTVLPMEVVKTSHPYKDMPLDHPIALYETAIEYRKAFYCPEWRNKESFAIVEWQRIFWNSETDERRLTMAEGFQPMYQVLVLEDLTTCKYYLCDRIATPMLNDGFTENHTKTVHKQLVNEQFVQCIREVDPTGKYPAYVLDTGNTCRHFQEVGASNALVVVNPDAALELPSGVDHQVCTMHEFMNCRFHQNSHKSGHIGLDYCGEFRGDRSKTLPEADLASLFEGVLDHNTILWVTFNMRHLSKHERDTHIETVFGYLQKKGTPLGFTLHLKHSSRYGVRNDMVYLIMHVEYNNRIPSLLEAMTLNATGKTKRLVKTRNFFDPSPKRSRFSSLEP
jgi:hypothetical protein